MTQLAECFGGSEVDEYRRRQCATMLVCCGRCNLKRVLRLWVEQMTGKYDKPCEVLAVLHDACVGNRWGERDRALRVGRRHWAREVHRDRRVSGNNRSVARR